jgi:hypothetical protein
LRALVVLAVAAAAAPFGAIQARASESGHEMEILKRSFSSPPVASAQTTLRALKSRTQSMPKPTHARHKAGHAALVAEFERVFVAL